jgi:single-stranded DNA-binding protein
LGKAAESCANNLHKGSVVTVTGALNVDDKTGEPRHWTSKDGVVHVSTDVNASRVDFISGFGKQAGGATRSKPDDKIYEESPEIPF